MASACHEDGLPASFNIGRQDISLLIPLFPAYLFHAPPPSLLFIHFTMMIVIFHHPHLYTLASKIDAAAFSSFITQAHLLSHFDVTSRFKFVFHAFSADIGLQ